MSRLGKKELADLVDPVEASYTYRHPQPATVRMADGIIKVRFPPETTGWIHTRKYVDPLGQSDFFTSFAKLAAQGRPSESKIRGWVVRFGLPVWGQRDADSMTIEDFVEEARNAHDLLHFYLCLRNEKAAEVRASINSPQSEAGIRLRESFYHNRRRWGLLELRVASQEQNDEMLLIASNCALGEVTTALVSNIHPRVGIQRGWYLTPSWDCPDLPSALYLQFYLLITGHKPIRYCDFCDQPFEATRRDKFVCNDSCRSGLRYQRRKMRQNTDTN